MRYQFATETIILFVGLLLITGIFLLSLYKFSPLIKFLFSSCEIQTREALIFTELGFAAPDQSGVYYSKEFKIPIWYSANDLLSVHGYCLSLNAIERFWQIWVEQKKEEVRKKSSVVEYNKSCSTFDKKWCYSYVVDKNCIRCMLVKISI